jgi:hypothetical protein
MINNNNNKKDEEIQEEMTSANVAGYNTPNAFGTLPKEKVEIEGWTTVKIPPTDENGVFINTKQ